MKDREQELAEMGKRVEKLQKKYEKAKKAFDDGESRVGYHKRRRILNKAEYKWRTAEENMWGMKWDALKERWGMNFDE